MRFQKGFAMKPFVKEIIAGMEKGWGACPKQLVNALYEGSSTEPTACCAVGHYLLGSLGEVTLKASFKPETWSLLAKIVELNNEQRMTTPEIIEWLKDQKYA